LREKVIREIINDPFWYLTILLKRLKATVFQTKILPWGPYDSKSAEGPKIMPDGTEIDSIYYKFLSNADMFIIKNHKVELPVQLIILPMLIMIVFRRNKEYVKIFLCVGTGLLILPVFITTYGGIETETFVLMYFLAFAFLVEETVIPVIRKFSVQ
jgi:hypothetical protein